MDNVGFGFLSFWLDRATWISFCILFIFISLVRAMADWHGKLHLLVTTSTQLPLPSLSLPSYSWEHHLPLIQSSPHFLSVPWWLVPLTPFCPSSPPEVTIGSTVTSAVPLQSLISPEDVQHWKLSVTHFSWHVSHQTLLDGFLPHDSLFLGFFADCFSSTQS